MAKQVMNHDDIISLLKHFKTVLANLEFEKKLFIRDARTEIETTHSQVCGGAGLWGSLGLTRTRTHSKRKTVNESIP